MLMDKLQESLCNAYSILLAVPHDTGTRVRIQPALAALRDELAFLSGNTPEDIQNHFEAVQVPN